jgi:Rieske Fe-S protein
VARPTDTDAVAFSAICTHQGCTVAPSGSRLNCPCHGSVFNALTGAVEHGPARSPLPSIPVKVVNGNVVTA